MLLAFMIRLSNWILGHPGLIFLCQGVPIPCHPKRIIPNRVDIRLQNLESLSGFISSFFIPKPISTSLNSLSQAVFFVKVFGSVIKLICSLWQFSSISTETFVRGSIIWLFCMTVQSLVSEGLTLLPSLTKKSDWNVFQKLLFLLLVVKVLLGVTNFAYLFPSAAVVFLHILHFFPFHLFHQQYVNFFNSLPAFANGPR